MREAGRVVARCLDAVRTASAPGVTLKELDTVAHDVMDDHGAKPAFLDYHPRFAPSPYPGVICASVSAGGEAIRSTFDTTNTGLQECKCNVSE